MPPPPVDLMSNYSNARHRSTVDYLLSSCEVHEQTSRSGGQSEARSPVFKSPKDHVISNHDEVMWTVREDHVISNHGEVMWTVREDHVISNHGEVMWTTPELAALL
ncbi:hypothetical protein TNCV_4987301 [Trichonephila clavipes]|nr:hypothetical protein TNCV_4987301 [Trichonephila clavipes]